MTAFYNSSDGQQAQGVFLINPSTGTPSGAVQVEVAARICLGTFRASVTSASQTLAAAIASAIPAGAVTCEIQADTGAVRLRRDAGVPTATLGYRLEVGVEKLVDTPLADVRLISESATTVFANVVFFDRV